MHLPIVWTKNRAETSPILTNFDRELRHSFSGIAITEELKILICFSNFVVFGICFALGVVWYVSQLAKYLNSVRRLSHREVAAVSGHCMM